MSKDRELFTEKVDVQVHVQESKALKLKDRRPLAVFIIICWVGMMWISPSMFEQNVVSGTVPHRVLDGHTRSMQSSSFAKSRIEGVSDLPKTRSKLFNWR